MNPITIDIKQDFHKLENRPDSGLFYMYGSWFPVYLTKLTFTPLLCQKHLNKVFVFGDNLDRCGKSGQAVIRDCSNSFGLRTKKEPSKVPGAYFTDRDYVWFCRVVDQDITNLKELNRNHPIVFSANGYGTGLAKLPTQAPKCFKYLCKQLNEFCCSPIFNPYYGSL